MESDPPLLETYKTLFGTSIEEETKNTVLNEKNSEREEFQLPVIDISRLFLDKIEGEELQRRICEAARVWGFFQVVNHGIPREILEKVKQQQVEMFQKPFLKKGNEDFMDISPEGCYRWGNPNASSPVQFSWSEAFHISMSTISASEYCNFSSPIHDFAKVVSELAMKIAEILSENLGLKSTFFRQNCLPSSCYLRMNRYPPCPISSEVFGLVPHTDSDFLTIIYQDEVGGLQLVKDGDWISVKPNPDALIINIGDLFQVWSNNVYKSIKHRVLVTSGDVDRYSIAYFFCPTFDTVIDSYCNPNSVYRSFSYGEYKKQTEEDVKATGCKIGLSRFLR